MAPLWHALCVVLQTYGLQLKNISAVEMCTSVSNVKEDSAAESAGLTAGEVSIHTDNCQTSLYMSGVHRLTEIYLATHVTYHPTHHTHPHTHTHADAQKLYNTNWSSRNLLLPFFCTSSFPVGDVIVAINGVSIEGSSHQDILALIRESTNSLMWVTATTEAAW